MKIRSPRNTIITRREGAHNTKSQATNNDSPKNPKNQRVESSSGEDPMSHPGLCESLASPQKASIIHRDTFSCSGGVNLGRLLGMTRERILDRAIEAGANCLVDEKWKCIITGPRRPRGAYKVQVSFAAKLKEDLARDPHKPVALDCAQGVPGLMTILEREE
ncbi:hypothetical protein L218DRAFT_867907 [Marasmius fiardii PR-910]|nr:hypothetical protein L218DRAFT_867907 [Marasmius fiardii PR-910]